MKQTRKIPMSLMMKLLVKAKGIIRKGNWKSKKEKEKEGR